MYVQGFTERPFGLRALGIAESCFSIPENLPVKEHSALISQLRRSAESISANIAGGFGRRTANGRHRFYDIASGSAVETISHLIYGERGAYFQSEPAGAIKSNTDGFDSGFK